jgi:hypothetical protein
MTFLRIGGGYRTGLQGQNGFYQDRYGLGCSNSARHDPTNTNGF